MARTLLVAALLALAAAPLMAQPYGNGSPLVMQSYITVASRTQVYTPTGQACSNLWYALGASIASINQAWFTGYNCIVTTGSSLPSQITMVLNFTTTGQGQPLVNTYNWLNNSAVWNTFLPSFGAGCQAEAMYSDIYQGGFPTGFIVAGPGPVTSLINPGRLVNYQVSTGACSPPPPPQPAPPPSPPPSPPPAPAMCVALFTVTSTAAIPYTAPFDNCRRFIDAALPWFTNTGVPIMPLCKQFGTASDAQPGVVSFQQAMLNQFTYNMLVGQVSTNVGTAAAILAALGINPCTSSISITSVQCAAGSPSFTGNNITMPGAFVCPKPPSPPPPAPATINVAFYFAGTTYPTCSAVTAQVTNTLAQAGYTLPSPMSCTATGATVTLYGAYSASLVNQLATYFTSAAGSAAIVQSTGAPCGSTYAVLPSTTGVSTTVSCSSTTPSLCCPGKRRLL